MVVSLSGVSQYHETNGGSTKRWASEVNLQYQFECLRELTSSAVCLVVNGVSIWAPSKESVILIWSIGLADLNGGSGSWLLAHISRLVQLRKIWFVADSCSFNAVALYLHIAGMFEAKAEVVCDGADYRTQICWRRKAISKHAFQKCMNIINDKLPIESLYDEIQSKCCWYYFKCFKGSRQFREFVVDDWRRGGLVIRSKWFKAPRCCNDELRNEYPKGQQRQHQTVFLVNNQSINNLTCS